MFLCQFLTTVCFRFSFIEDSLVSQLGRDSSLRPCVCGRQVVERLLRKCDNFGPPKELPRAASEVELEGVWER